MTTVTNLRLPSRRYKGNGATNIFPFVAFRAAMMVTMMMAVVSHAANDGHGGVKHGALFAVGTTPLQSYKDAPLVMR